MGKNKGIAIHEMIFEVRGKKVMLDRDLADLYGVEVKRINEAVKRNSKRFPPEFMFKLTDKEWEKQRSQIATFNQDTRKYKPYAFTEHGILMLSSILNSDKAIEVNINIMKIFVQMRNLVQFQTGTNEQITELRKLLMLHIESNNNEFSEHDKAIRHICSSFKQSYKTTAKNQNDWVSAIMNNPFLKPARNTSAINTIPLYAYRRHWRLEVNDGKKQGYYYP